MGRRSAHCVLARPELAIPAKNDKADISAAEREKDNHSRKMPCNRWYPILSIIQSLLSICKVIQRSTKFGGIITAPDDQWKRPAIKLRRS